MQNFWPSLFAFVAALLLMIWAFDPTYIGAALAFLGLWLTLMLYVLLVAIVGALGIAGYLVYARMQNQRNRPVDGAYPLQRFRLRNGRTMVLNPTHMIGAAAVVDRNTGNYEEIEHPAGWQTMAEVRHTIERSNAVRAMFPGDRARTDRFGAMSKMPSAAGARQLIDKPPAPRVIGDPPPQAPTPAPTIDIANGMRHNTAQAFAVGQTKAGEIVRWDTTQYPHARFHGASQGSGKTNAARTVLAGMARAGAHVVVLDRRRFKDFRDFSSNAELIDTSNPAAFVEVLTRLETIYRERDRLLGQHGAANIDDLPQRLVRYVVMVTEFGALCSVADGDGVLQDAMQPLTRIMREAGAAGIHLIFEDQIVERGKWPRGVAANAGGIFTGYLPLNLGAAGGYHHAHKLPKFHFHHDGQILKTWDVRPAMRQLLATAPAYDARLAVLDGQARSHGEGERSQLSPPTPTSGERANEHNSEQSANGAKWDDLTIAFFQQRPEYLTGPARGVTELARTMAAADGRGKPYGDYKSIAHEYYHNIRNEVRLPGGGRLG